MDQAVNPGRFQGTLMPISERPTVHMIMMMNLNNNTEKNIFFKTFVFVIHNKKTYSLTPTVKGQRSKLFVHVLLNQKAEMDLFLPL